jgi:hypothetical protein
MGCEFGNIQLKKIHRNVLVTSLLSHQLVHILYASTTDKLTLYEQSTPNFLTHQVTHYVLADINQTKNASSQ